MKISFISLVTVTLALALPLVTPANTLAKPGPLRGHRQLMVVLNGGWDKLQGKLYCYNLQGGRWRLKFTNQIVVGSKGMGIGDGIIKMTIPGAPCKKRR